MKNGYKNLSKDELYLISRAEFEKQTLITTQFAQKLFPNKNKASRVLVFLTKKGRLIRIEKGKYILVPIKAPNQQWMPSEFIVADLWMGDTPYYIGYFTMYNYWGFTEQIPRTIFVLNTAKSCKREISGIRYEAVKIDSKKYYGVEKIKVEDREVNVSDKERTLVDFAYNPLGSLRNFEIALQENINNIDIKKFISYLIKFPVVSVRKRAGFLLQELGCQDKTLDLLRKSIGEKRVLVLLNPYNQSRKGKINKEWMVIVNR
ncbi:MAG TPA: type IV toxin-antitoxin system AbiEi family antitoxin [Candidatus Omnitrophota bacterium]|nr:type IV toxin-antitoxin system AbiEi family antitoxin [Candidatus Omnitrophota bacterium]